MSLPPGSGAVAHVQVQFAIDDPARADGMVDRLLADHLVACGQRVGPVVSRYWWQGERVVSDEWLVLLKTRAELAPRVVEAVVAAHPYEAPEVVVVDLVSGAPGYLAWIDEVTGAAGTIGRSGETEEP
jgi:periplasmic divalent cation tolerance protein